MSEARKGKTAGENHPQWNPDSNRHSDETTECQCGCGITFKKYDSKGRERKWVMGHHRYGEIKSDAGYGAHHQWLNRNYPKLGICEECGERSRTQYAYEGENGGYSRDRGDYIELCSSCHKTFDLAKAD